MDNMGGSRERSVLGGLDLLLEPLNSMYNDTEYKRKKALRVCGNYTWEI